MIIVIFYINPKLKLTIVVINSSNFFYLFLNENYNKRNYLHKIKTSNAIFQSLKGFLFNN